MRIGIGIFIILLLSDVASAQIRKYSNEFLAIGVGAQALGMSNSVVASTNDATSAYWNPAGLTSVNCDLQAAAMHAEYFAGIAKYDYGTLAKPLDSNSVIAFTFIRFGVDDIPNTTELIDADGNVNYDRISSFTAADHAFLVSFARKMGITGLTTGANAKVIYRKVGDFASATGFGLDAGVQYKTGVFSFGATIRDITTTVNVWRFNLSDRMKEVWTLTGNEIPVNSTEITMPKLLLGASGIWTFKEHFQVRPEIDLDISTDGKRNVLIVSDPFSIDPHLGVEVAYKKLIFVRGGLGNIQRSKNAFGNRTLYSIMPNFGVGLKLKNLSIDYALTDIGDQSEALYSNIFSLRLDVFKNNK